MRFKLVEQQLSSDPPRIFISHSWIDKSLARRLEKCLIRSGAKVWIDFSKVRGGDHIAKRVSDALEWCDHLLLVWTHNSRESKWVQLEMNSAISLHKKIIPCLFDNTKLPGILAGMAHIEFSDFSRGLFQLLSSLQLAVPKKSSSAATRRFRPRFENGIGNWKKIKRLVKPIFFITLPVLIVTVSVSIYFAINAKNIQPTNDQLINNGTSTDSAITLNQNLPKSEPISVKNNPQTVGDVSKEVVNKFGKIIQKENRKQSLENIAEVPMNNPPPTTTNHTKNTVRIVDDPRDNSVRPVAKIAKVEGDYARIDIGILDGIQKGHKFKIIREVNDGSSSTTILIGYAQVWEVFNNTSALYCRVISGFHTSVGDILVPDVKK